MNNYELYISDYSPDRNFVTGRFLKGRIPHNKGRKWEEWLPAESRAKSLLNLVHKGRNIGGWNKKAVIGITRSGGLVRFQSSREAGLAFGIQDRNIRSVCNGKRKTCGGIRWFYEDSKKWISYLK